MSARNEKAQSWEFKTATIGGLSLELKVPQDPTLSNEKGETDIPVGRIKAHGKTIVDNISLPVADFSNLITAGYRHLVLGGVIGDAEDRAIAIDQVVVAMKWLNYNGASQLIKETYDSGSFEFMGNTVTFQRQVSGSKVTTSYNTQTLAVEDGSLRQGTWTLLESFVADVKTPLDEYTAYASAYVGEEVDTDKE